MTEAALLDAFFAGLTVLEGGMTQKAVAQWMAGYFELRGEVEDWVIRCWALNSAERREAEELLVTLLTMQHLCSVGRSAKSVKLQRHTNWSKTLVAAAGQPIQHYHYTAPQQRYDDALYSSLIHLGESWCAELNRFPGRSDFAVRKEKLQKVLASRNRRRLPVFYDANAREKLRGHSEAGRTFVNLYQRQSFIGAQPFSREDEDTLKELFADKQFSVDNENHLLEAVATLSIAKILQEQCGWNMAARKEPLVLALRKGDLECRVHKGGIRHLDQSKQLRAGETKVSGMDPDIVLEFRKEDSAILLLGDAKNYQASQLDVAFRAMIMYMLSFSKALGLTPDATLPQLFAPSISPAVLLFFAKIDEAKIQAMNSETLIRPFGLKCYNHNNTCSECKNASKCNSVAKTLTEIEEQIKKLKKWPLKVTGERLEYTITGKTVE